MLGVEGAATAPYSLFIRQIPRSLHPSIPPPQAAGKNLQTRKSRLQTEPT